MIIRNFEDKDIEQASKIAHLVWGDLYTNESKELQKLIYDFMIEYYDLNRKYSFSILDEDVKAFLLSGLRNDKNNSTEIYKQKILKLGSKKEQKIAFELLEYLEHCGQEVKNIMTNYDIMLNLFISQQKGYGKILLRELSEICKQNNIKNIYLWTDTTCDYSYYAKNDFNLVKETTTFINSRNVKTIIYRKNLY